MGKLMIYNIIGDIHGRKTWKEVVDDDAVNVFVGDYFDPYFGEGITEEDTVKNFTELMEYGKTHKCVFLYGNHDLCEYVWDSESCGRRQSNAEEVKALFEKYKDMFHGVAYSINNKYLVSHAGVSENWFKIRCEHKDVLGCHDTSSPERDIERTPDAVANAVNDLFKASEWGHEFLLTCNTYLSDCYGVSTTNSPLWCRSVPDNSVFTQESGFIQVFGHTKTSVFRHEGIWTVNMCEDGSDKMGNHGKVVNVDCLGHVATSYKVKIEEDE